MIWSFIDAEQELRLKWHLRLNLEQTSLFLLVPVLLLNWIQFKFKLLDLKYGSDMILSSLAFLII